MKDPISINLNCQGCPARRRIVLEYDGYGRWFFEEGPGESAEFDLHGVIELVNFSLENIGPTKALPDDTRFLCPKCRKKAHDIKRAAGASQKKQILHLFDSTR